MSDDIARRLQITTESIKTGSASLLAAATGEEINILRRQLDAAKLVISGLELRAATHGNEIETLGAQAADVAGERAANAVLTTEVERLRAAIEAFRQDAERYRHAEAHGWPMRAPKFIAWTRNCGMRFGDTQESALDAAMQGSELVRPNV